MGDTQSATRPPSRGTARAHPRLHQYELIRELGHGGMGTVYLARDTRLARRVAIKFLAHSSPEIAARFLVEARATARCSHENIVVIHEVDEVEGQPYMVLEYLEGRTLRQLMDGTPMSPSRAIELIVPVVRALVAAHAGAIVHRDLKPENILVTDTGQVKVLDFGIAKLHGEPEVAGGSAGEAGDTHASALVGTLPYMSPEQWGADDVDHRTDVWAVGIVLFELLAGAHPLAPATRDRLMEAALRLDAPMPALASAVPSIDLALDRVVARCLAKRKADRIASAEELLAALEPHLPRRRTSGDGDTSPYPGLTAFREEDADLFFGRSAEVARLAAILRDRPLAAVVGASGAGKSSLVRAGLVPELKRHGRWEVGVTRPGRHPLDALALAVRTLTSSADRRADDAADALASRLATEPGALGVLLRERAAVTGGRVLLFIDQFEELFTLVDDVRVRAAYLACLLGAADDPLSPVRVIVSLRADFLDRVASDAAFIAALTPGIQLVAAADRESLRAALVEPARYAGHRFETDAMVDAMIGELAATAGALPLLQFAASRLWQERDRKARLLTQASFERIGGIAGALAAHADAVIEALPPVTRELARRLCLRLVTPERTRDVVEVGELEELGEAGAVRALLDHLVAARLVAIRSGTGPATAELVHESLIERWPALRSWLDHTQEDAAFLARLRTAARQWEDGNHSAGLLWRSEAEQDARHWLRTYRGELGRRERAYLDAVFRLADRAARTRRFVVAGTMAALVLVAIAAVVALIWIRNAETSAVHEAARAREQADNARAANEKLKADDAKQKELLESLQRETAASEAARAAAAASAEQVEQARAQLERANVDLRAALARAEAESHHAKTESERAVAESERAHEAAEKARAAQELAEQQRLKAEDLANKERERANKRGKLSTTLP